MAEIALRFGPTRQRVCAIVASGNCDVDLPALRREPAAGRARAQAVKILRCWRQGLAPAEIGERADVSARAVREMVASLATKEDRRPVGGDPAPRARRWHTAASWQALLSVADQLGDPPRYRRCAEIAAQRDDLPSPTVRVRLGLWPEITAALSEHRQVNGGVSHQRLAA